MMTNKIVKEISENQFQLPDTNYLCCSKFFYRDWRITQSFNDVEWLGISESESKRFPRIINNLCALANQGGGVLLIGVNPSNNTISGL